MIEFLNNTRSRLKELENKCFRVAYALEMVTGSYNCNFKSFEKGKFEFKQNSTGFSIEGERDAIYKVKFYVTLCTKIII